VGRLGINRLRDMRILLSIGFLFLAINSFSQTETISSKSEEKVNLKSKPQITTDVDISVYVIQQGNSYYTKDEKSAIQAEVILMPFETMKNNMQKSSSDIVDKGEVNIKGVNVLFVKKISKDRANIILIYCKENDKNSSLSFISFYPKEKENYYKPIIEKAFLSAKIKE
jgi:hypothetical protein